MSSSLSLLAMLTAPLCHAAQMLATTWCFSVANLDALCPSSC